MSRHVRFSAAVLRSGRLLSLIVLVAGLILTNFPVFVVHAAEGDLDPAFGSGGKVTTDFRGHGDVGQALAIQDDGKIIAAGYSLTADIFFAEDFAIARYNPDGSLDSSFGSGGKVTIDFFGDQDEIHDVAVQPDHKILAVGFARAGAIFYTAVVRYNPDGSLDPSFGVGGKVLTLPPGHDGEGNAVVIQPDNKIVVAGRTTSDSGNVTFGLWRYNPDGSLDPTFGSGGFVNTNLFGNFDIALGLVRQPDGKLVAGGLGGPGETGSDYALARYNPDGSLDATFGSGGKVSTDFFGLFDFGRALALQPDGKLVLAGDIEQPVTEDSSFGLARYNPDGSLDPTFGSGGKVVADIFGLSALNLAVVIRPGGKIVSAGGAGANFALAQFNADGSLDANFGSGGKVLTSFGNFALAFDLALQSDGKLIALGTGGAGDFALARYEGESFNLCLQDDSNGNLLQINTTTGDYQFTNCGGLSIGGTGTLTKRGSLFTLQHNAADRRVLATVDTLTSKGTASIQLFSAGVTFSVSDRNITNNTCVCK